MALPVTRKINARLPIQSEVGNLANLLAIGYAAVIFAPRRLLRVTQEIGTGDMVMMTGFRATQAGEIAFRPIRASAVEAVSLLVIDAAHFKAAV
jgi:hypothetical protein